MEYRTESSYRKRVAEAKKFYENVFSHMINDEYSQEIKEQRREIYKERQKLRDEKNEYHALLREQARMELFYERIDEAVEKLLSRKQRDTTFQSNGIVSVDGVETVVAFADPHYGADFCIKGFNGKIISEYNPNIFERRMWELKREVSEFCRLHNTNKISIVDLGDSIEGILHLSQLKCLRGNIVDDIMDYLDFIEEWIYSLYKEGYIINYYTSEGNHSDLRLLTGKKNDFPHENLEKIYSRGLQKAFKNNPNVKIHKSLDGLNYFNVNGFNVLTAHGNKENNLKNSISDYEDTYDISVDYFLVGHLHSKNEFEPAQNKEVIQVRSVMGINEYSKDIKKTSLPGATMFTIHKDYGKKYVNEVKFLDAKK